MNKKIGIEAVTGILAFIFLGCALYNRWVNHDIAQATYDGVLAACSLLISLNSRD